NAERKSVLPFANIAPSGLGQPELVNVDGFTMISVLFQNIQKHPSDKHVFFYASIRRILTTEPNENDTWAKLLDLT
ncbi:hypothetical protein, partial [Stenotrophomonas maltophilia]|uniref:hypothetical protein n=1 Tax=Stenotrophomonas maltophilia TaxID=40324 RepID=UPI0019544371